MNSIAIGLAGVQLEANFSGELPCLAWTTGRSPTTRARLAQLASRDPRIKHLLKFVQAWERGNVGHAAVVRDWIPSTPPFFAACWTAAMRIPRGETRSYAWLARAAGRPRATRAAASAMARNPLSLLVPCHRVVGTNDEGGFCGVRANTVGKRSTSWELKLKRRLLEIERSTPTQRKRA